MERLQQIKADLQWAHCPAVMVLAAPAVQSACTQRNGLGLAELLRPFGFLRQLNGTVGVPVRTPAEHPLRLHSWRLRFYSADSMFQPAADAADAYLRGLLSEASREAGGSEVLGLQELLSSAGRHVEPPTPWYHQYRGEYLRLMQFGEHETLDHPVACVLALPANQDGDLATAFAALWQPEVLPPPMQAGVMECTSAAVVRCYVLVHDAASQGPEVLAAAQQRLHQLRGILGHSCHLISINNGNGTNPPVDPCLWADMLHRGLPGGGGGEPTQRPAVPPGGLGSWLSEGDMSALAGFVHELAVRCILPHMEMRLRALNAQVTANRKGFKNQLKSLLWRKGGSSLGGAPGSSGSSSLPGTPSAGAGAAAVEGHVAVASAYTPGSVELQMRQLSDLSLMLGDTDTACSTMRLLAADTKADRAYKAYAGVQEALGAAAVLAGAPPSEALAGYKEALYRYAQLTQVNPRNREGVRYATRCVLVLAPYLQSLGQFSEASAALMKAHFQEDNLRAGLLLEQAAHCLLCLQPPHTRKFAFHLVLAGLRFDMCGLKTLSARAYTQVLGVYEGRQWGLIEEHLHDALGRQAREGGDATGAVRHFMHMLDCPANNPYCQRLYLAQFSDALHQAQAQLGFPLPLELPLPRVDLERASVLHDGQTCYCGEEARHITVEEWGALEATLQPGVEPHTSGAWLEGGSRVRMGDALEPQPSPHHTCCVGEVVGVEVELHNPLHLDLQLTSLHLACTWEPAAAASAAAAGTNVAVAAGGGSKQQAQEFQVHEESVTLNGGERVMVQLRVVPLRVGNLQVHGLAWLLNGVAHGHAAFRIPRMPPSNPGCAGSGSKVLVDANRARPGGILLRVLPPMPHLKVSLQGLPRVLLAGQVVRCVMRLRNSGAVPLHRLSMAASGSATILLGAAPHTQPGSGSTSSSTGGGVGRLVADSPTARVTAQQQQPASPLHPGYVSSGAVAADGGLPIHQRSCGGGSIVQVAAEVLPHAHFRQRATLFSLPDVQLGVGQELTLPIWYRSPHAGPAPLVVCWRYEPLVRLEGLPYRTARFAQAVQALPSLHLSARLAPGLAGCAPGGCLLQAQVHNLSAEPIAVVGLACHSSTWQLSSESTGVSGRSGGIDSGSSLMLPPEDSAVVHRLLEPAGNGPATATVIPSRAAAAAWSGMTTAEVALVEASRQMAAALLPSHNHPHHAQQQQQLNSSQLQQQQERRADVIVAWQAEGKDGLRPQRGFCCLHDLRLHAAPPIDAQLGGPTSISHDFVAAPLCLLPLTLVLRNTMAAPAAVCVELGRLPEGQSAPTGVPTWAPHQPQAQAAALAGAANVNPAEAPDRAATAAAARGTSMLDNGGGGAAALTAPAALPAVRQHVWCGSTRLTLPAVPPGQVVRVSLRAAISWPGKLELADCAVSWHFAGPPHVLGSRCVPPHHCMVAQR